MRLRSRNIPTLGVKPTKSAPHVRIWRDHIAQTNNITREMFASLVPICT